MDLIQSNGQPHYGRFSELPKTIDLDKYQYKTPYGEVLTGWRKRLKYKKFAAFNMNTIPLVLQLPILLGQDMVLFIFMIILKMKCLNGMR